jgi:hypothetical protein
MMDSTTTDPELRQWLRWASELGNAPAFVRKVADAACLACLPEYELLRPVLMELKRLHPQPQPDPAAPGDPELWGWLCWASGGANAPSFVRVLAEAAFCACAGDYELLRPVLLELRRRHPERLARRKGQDART